MAIGEVEFKTYINEIDGKSFCYIIGEYNEEVVAMGSIDNLDTDIYWIRNVSVHEDLRRKGIGSAVMENIIRIAKSEGKQGISVYVKKDNAAAIRLYEKKGFIKTYDNENDFMYTFIINENG